MFLSIRFAYPRIRAMVIPSLPFRFATVIWLLLYLYSALQEIFFPKIVVSLFVVNCLGQGKMGYFNLMTNIYMIPILCNEMVIANSFE